MPGRQIAPGVLLSFPLARGTPEIWRFGTTPRGLIIRAYDFYRRRVPSDLRKTTGYHDEKGILVFDKGGLSGNIHDVDVEGADYVVEAQSAEDFGEEQHERNFQLLSEAAGKLGSKLIPVVPGSGEQMISEYARFLEVLEDKHLNGRRFEIVALDPIRYAYKGAGALGTRHYEDIATITSTAKAILGKDRTLLVGGLSPASMIVTCHAGAGLLGTLSWLSAATYGRLLLSTGEQFVPADLDEATIKQKLAKCACPICRIEPRHAKSLAEYLELKPSMGEERFSIYTETSTPGFRARCIHNAYAIVQMVERANKVIALSEGNPTASSFVAIGFHLPEPVMRGLRTVDRIRASRMRT
jgi:hypothetical protein